MDAHKPFTALAGNRDIAQFTQHIAAVVVAYPAEFGQENPAIALVELDLLGVRVAEAVAIAFALESREVSAFGKEVFVGFFQIFEGMLQGL